MEQNKKRCNWLNLKNPIYIKYHDEEWGKPVHDDKKLYELLILECFQAGLSWECVLNKRENFKKAYDNFEIEKVIKDNSSGKICLIRHLFKVKFLVEKNIFIV